ncbi:MAG: diaminopimelate epimerase [Nitrospirota bacterium]
MRLSFVKMHGLGNDFVIIDCREDEFGVRSLELEDLSRKLCHRRFGIGADQLLLLYPSSIADFKMRIFNADGGEVEMCGNGIRCIAKYIWDRGLSVRDVLEIETIAGIIKPERAGDMVRVDMGEPILEPEKIPVKISSEFGVLIIDYPLRINDREFKMTCVSMGNPHAVIFVDKVDEFPVSIFGPDIERHHLFPNKTNVEFIEVIGRDEIKIRAWERGVGETMACGTGASASAVASNIKGLTDRKVTVHLLGGDLFIEWSETDNHVYMTGPAVEVFEGMVEV